MKREGTCLLLIQCGFIINISDSLKHSSQWMNGDEGIVGHRVNDLLVRSADCLVSGNDRSYWYVFLEMEQIWVTNGCLVHR